MTPPHDSSVSQPPPITSRGIQCFETSIPSFNLEVSPSVPHISVSESAAESWQSGREKVGPTRSLSRLLTPT